MLNEREMTGGGGGGEDPRKSPRASVALTAQQWSAITMAVSHGARAVMDSKTIPLSVITQFMADISEASEEISRRLQCEALRRGKSE